MKFFIVDAFTETPFQGNPAGVFLEEDANLSDERRMLLCAEMALESAFVLPGDGEADLTMRYYTGAMEVPFCGHATVAAMTALAEAGRIASEGTYRVGTKAGVLPVTLARRGEQTFVTLHQRPGEFIKDLAAETREVMKALEVAEYSGHLPKVVSTGSPWLLYQVNNEAVVDGIDPKRCADAIMQVSRRQEVLGIYVFAVRTNFPVRGDAAQIWGRCFCPIADLPEDPVTGSALGCVGCYLAEYGHLATVREISLSAIQGFAGKRWGTGQVRVVRAENGGWQASVTGTAVIVARGEIFAG